MNTRLEIHQFDTAEVRTAKRYLNGEIATIGALEMRRILLAALDDREQWSAKATIARDLMIERVTTDEMFRTESDRKLIAAMLTEVREISAMLRPSDNQPRTTDELNDATPNILRRQAD